MTSPILKYGKLILITSILLCKICYFSVAQWDTVYTGGPYGIGGLFFTNKDTGYASAGDGVLKTLDGGNTWTKDTTIRTSALFFANDTIGYTPGYIMPSGTVGILKTENGGMDWTLQNTATFASYFSKVYCLNPDTCYAVSNDVPSSVIKTVDGGINWNNITSIGFDGGSDVFFINQNLGFAAGGEIMKTTNGGINWNPYSPRIWNYIVSIYFVNENTGYAVGDTAVGPPYANWGIILKTTDGGATWTKQIFPDVRTYNSVFFPTPNIGYVVGGDIMKTTDGGTTWLEQLPSGNIGFTSVFCIDSNICYASGRYGANSGIILKITNGGGLGIENQFTIQNAGCTIYPNPFSHRSTIRCNFSATVNVNLTLYNLYGQKIKNIFSGNQSAGEHALQLNADEMKLSQGVYFLELQTAQQRQYQKIIIIK